MTISSGYLPILYLGNGTTVDFATGFSFADENALQVYVIRVADGARALAILGAQYTVAGAGVDSGGTVTTLPDIANLFLTSHPLTSAYQIEISRSTPIVQNADFVNNDGDDAEVKEDAFDRLTMICQELSQQLGAAVIGGPGAISFTNGVPPLASEYTVPIYSGVTGTTHKLRVIMTGDTSLKSAQITGDYVRLRDTGLDDIAQRTLGILLGDTVDDSSGAAVRQLKNDTGKQAFLAFWEGSVAAADAKRWAFANDNDGEISFAAVSDDMVSTTNPFMTWIRSGVTAVKTRLDVNLDANGKRILSVATIDYNDVNLGNSGTSKAIDWTAGNFQYVTMTGNCTFTFTAPSKSCVLHLIATQSSGGHTMTLPAAVKWTTGTLAGDKLLSTGASKRDLLVLRYDAVSGHYLAQLNKDW